MSVTKVDCLSSLGVHISSYIFHFSKRITQELTCLGVSGFTKETELIIYNVCIHVLYTHRDMYIYIYMYYRNWELYNQKEDRGLVENCEKERERDWFYGTLSCDCRAGHLKPMCRAGQHTGNWQDFCITVLQQNSFFSKKPQLCSLGLQSISGHGSHPDDWGPSPLLKSTDCTC